MIVDSHCHLYMLEDSGQLETVLERAATQGIRHFLNVAVDLETYPNILAAAQKHPQVFASVGIHPNTPLDDNETDPEQLESLARDRHVVAVGETGLDYFRSEGDLEWQRQRFRRHIAVAKSVNKPLIIHTRESGPDVIRILQEEGADQVGGVMHCFVDDWKIAQQALALNFYISFSGIVTFKSAAQVQDVARRVPLDRLLVETDSPYLAPVPHRGKPNEPAYVRHVAEFIAKLRNLSLEEVAEASTKNFFRLFSSATAVA